MHRTAPGLSVVLWCVGAREGHSQCPDSCAPVMLLCGGAAVARVLQVVERIGARAAARQAKDFGAADAVRKELAAKGIMLMDSPQGTSWRPGLAEDAGN